MNPKEKIEQILAKNFSISHLEVVDDSASHAGHNPDAAEGGTHFNIIIVSEDFKGLPLIKRHRMVNSALKDEFTDRLHALALKTYTPDEI